MNELNVAPQITETVVLLVWTFAKFTFELCVGEQGRFGFRMIIVNFSYSNGDQFGFYFLLLLFSLLLDPITSDSFYFIVTIHVIRFIRIIHIVIRITFSQFQMFLDL